MIYGAGLMTKRKSPSGLAQFLFTRGLWLIFVEWFIISTASTFSPFGIAQLGGLGIAQGFDARQLMTSFYYYPKGYGTGLAGVYIVWMLVIAILYPFCNWMAGIKARRKDWWLSYL